MSSTNRGAVRNESDFYPTPAWCVDLLMLHWLPAGAASSKFWLDPCAGDGAIIRAVEQHRQDIRWTAVELREDAREQLSKPNGAGQPERLKCPADFLTMPTLIRSSRYDVAIMNPPFRLQMEFLDRALMSAHHVACLSRLGWLAAKGRAGWLQLHRPDQLIISPRPSFTGTGSDSSDYCWLMFPGSGKWSVVVGSPGPHGNSRKAARQEAPSQIF